MHENVKKKKKSAMCRHIYYVSPYKHISNQLRIKAIHVFFYTVCTDAVITKRALSTEFIQGFILSCLYADVKATKSPM